MSGRIHIGSYVSTEAWRFDVKGIPDEDKWSFKQFGSDWIDGRVYGKVTGRNEGKCDVKWDIDGREFAFESDVLQKESDGINSVQRINYDELNDEVDESGDENMANEESNTEQENTCDSESSKSLIYQCKE